MASVSQLKQDSKELPTVRPKPFDNTKRLGHNGLRQVISPVYMAQYTGLLRLTNLRLDMWIESASLPAGNAQSNQAHS